MSFFGNFFKKVFGSSGSSNAGRTTQPRTYFKGYTPNTPKYTSSSVGNGQYSYRTTSAQGEKSGESKKETPKVYTSKEEEYKRKRIADSYEQERNRQKLKKAKADGAYEKITGDDKRTNAQKKLAQKMLLNDRMEAENKYSAKYQPHLHAMSKGAVRGATLGASDLLEKKASKGYKKIEADYKKNQTDTDKFIEGATELATTGLMFGASKGISEKALSKAVKVGDKATKGLVTKGGKAVEKKLVKKFGETEGKKLAKSLAEDFAIDSTTGNIMAAINASQEEGDLKDKAKAFAKESALNSILSTGITVAPTVIKNNKALREAIPKAKGKFNASEMPKLKDEAFASRKNFKNADVEDATGKLKYLKEDTPSNVINDVPGEQEKFETSVNRLMKKENISRDQAEAQIERERRNVQARATSQKNLDIKRELESLDADTPLAQRKSIERQSGYEKFDIGDSAGRRFDERRGIQDSTKENRDTLSAIRTHAEGLDYQVEQIDEQIAKLGVDKRELQRRIAKTKSSKRLAELNRQVEEINLEVANLNKQKQSVSQAADEAFNRISKDELPTPRTELPTSRTELPTPRTEEPQMAELPPRAEQPRMAMAEEPKVTSPKNEVNIEDLQVPLDENGQPIPEIQKAVDEMKSKAMADEDIPMDTTPADNTKRDLEQLAIGEIRRQPKGLTPDAKIRRAMANDLPDITNEAEASEFLKNTPAIASNPDAPIGQFERDIDNLLNKHQEMLRNGDYEGANAMRQQVKEAIERADRSDYNAEILNGKNASEWDASFDKINGKIDNSNISKEGRTNREVEQFDASVDAKNEVLKDKGRRTSDTLKSAYGQSRSTTEATILKDAMKNDSYFEYGIEGNSENIDSAVHRIWYSGKSPMYYAEKIKRFVTTGENPRVDDYLKTKYEALVLRAYASINLEHPDPEVRKQFVDLLDLTNNYIATRSIMEGQSIQANSAFTWMNPASRVAFIQGNIDKMLKSSKLTKNLSVEKLIEDSPFIAEAFENMKNAETMEDLIKAQKQVYLGVHSILPKTVLEWFNQLRYLHMLLSIPTHGRNMLGALSNTIKQIADDSITGAIESGQQDLRRIKVNENGELVSKIVKDTEQNRAKYGSALTENGERLVRSKSANPIKAMYQLSADKNSKAYKYFEDSWSRDKDGLMSSIKYAEDRMNFDVVYNRKGQLVAKNKLAKLIDKISGANDWALNVEDQMFMKFNYRKEFAEVCEANKLGKPGQVLSDDEILKMARAKAQNEALYMTFRESSEVAQTLQNYASVVNDPNANMLKRTASGVLSFNAPFIRTPYNVLKQSAVDNSTIGAIKGGLDVRKALEIGDTDLLQKGINEMAKGLTGTGIGILGLYLGMREFDENGYVTTKLGSDVEDKKLKNLGFVNYAVRVGDYDIPLSALSPEATMFFTGAEVGKIIKNKGKDGEDMSFFDKVSNMEHLMSRLIEPTLNMNMTQNLTDVLEASTSDSEMNPIGNIIRHTAVNVANQGVPNLVKQAGRVVAPNDYMLLNTSQSEGGRNMEYELNKMKTPFTGIADAITGGTSEDNPLHLAPAVDVRGNVKGTEGKGEKFLRYMVSPINPSKITADSTDKELISVAKEIEKDPALKKRYGSLGIDTVDYTSKVKVGDNEMQLTPDETSKRNEAKQTSGGQSLKSLTESTVWNKSKWRMDEGQKEALISRFDGKSLHDVETWLVSTPQYKNADTKEKAQMLDAIYGDGAEHLDGGYSAHANEKLYESRGLSAANYHYDNEATDKQRQAFDEYLKSGQLDYETTLAVIRAAKKVSYSDNPSTDGQRNTYYSRESIITALDELGIEDENLRAIYYNALKNPNAGEYTPGMSAKYSRGGYGRRGYRRYGRHGSRRKSTPKVSKPTVYKSSAPSYGRINKIQAGERAGTKQSGTHTTVTDAYLKQIENQAKLKK